MAGRDVDWTHIRVLGDEAAGQPYVAFGRKLLGMVREDAAFNGLTTHQLTKQLEDGAVVTAEIRGGIPRITITPPAGAPPPREIEIPARFVCTPTGGAFPPGLDPSYPEVILEKKGKGWGSLLYSIDSPGYAAVPRPKASYRMIDGEVVFPDGIRHAGNVDWRSKRGLTVHWHGPSSRYWYDGWRQPSEQYGGFVFMLGQVLLDLQQYADDSDEHNDYPQVVGAAVDLGEKRLYVVQSSMADQPDELPSASATLNVTPPSPIGAIPTALFRYDIGEDPSRVGPARYKIVAKSRALLWSDHLPEACNCWFFNQSITRAVSYSVPAKVGVYVTASGGTIEDITAYDPPSPYSYKFDLSRNDSGEFTCETTQISLGPGSASAPVASDFVDDNEVVASVSRYPEGVDPRALHFTLGGVATVPLYVRDTTGDPNYPDAYTFMHIMWVDLRESALSAYYGISNLSDWGPGSHPSGFYDYTFSLFVVDGKIVHNELLNTYSVVDAANNWQDRPKYGFFGGAAYASAPAAWFYMVQAGDLQLTTVNNGALFTMLGQCDVFPYTPADQIFGGAVSGDGTARFSQNAHTPDLPRDQAGKTWLFGGVAYKGDALFTARINVTASNSTGTALLRLAYLTNGDLAERTAVSGDDANYQPVWLLGALPRQIIN